MTAQSPTCKGSEAVRRSPLGMEPGRLWSLWDVYELDAGRFLSALNMFSSTNQAMMISSAPRTLYFSNRLHNEFIEHADYLKSISISLGLGVTAANAEALLTEFRHVFLNDGSTVNPKTEAYIRLQACLNRLQEGALAELQSKKALFLSPAEVEKWHPQAPLFGKDFQAKFPKAQYDLEEAGKTLAVARATACVFHLMRVVELALFAVHECLGIKVNLTGNNRNWGSILGRVQTVIENKGNKWTEKNTFQELYAMLIAVKDAWRNPTMHVETKYTLEDSERIFVAVSGFMRQVSSRCDEQGEPKA